MCADYKCPVPAAQYLQAMLQALSQFELGSLPSTDEWKKFPTLFQPDWPDVGPRIIVAQTQPREPGSPKTAPTSVS